jgi:ATP-dependent Lon protease
MPRTPWLCIPQGRDEQEALAEALDIDPKLFEGKTIHVHVPAGAIPKDGPCGEVRCASWAT